jgi:hypothetical protein
MIIDTVVFGMGCMPVMPVADCSDGCTCSPIIRLVVRSMVRDKAYNTRNLLCPYELRGINHRFGEAGVRPFHSGL